MLPDSYSLHSLLIQGPTARLLGGFRNTRRLGPQGWASPLSSTLKRCAAGTFGEPLHGSRSIAPITVMARSTMMAGVNHSARAAPNRFEAPADSPSAESVLVSNNDSC